MKQKETSIPHGVLEHLLDEEKLKNCFECGICTASCPMTELIPNNYNPRILLEKIYHEPEKALKDPALWLCAWCYRCYRHCPQKIKLPEVFLAIRKLAKEQGHLESFDQALEIISQETAFPVSFGYVCLHPERVELKDVLERFSKHQEGGKRKAKTSLPNEPNGSKVAVIGAGPAGLTAAHDLAGKGYTVTVFESSTEPGGMLEQCIPEFRLPRKSLTEEIEHIKDLGVEMRTGVKIGKDLKIDNLWQDGFKAVFISVGAHKTRKLKVEGEDLSGIFDALDLLRKVNNGEKVEVGERVAVVGGGNVAIDSARTAVRLGAKEVSILYRRSIDEMPANPYEIDEARTEGVKLLFLTAPKRVVGKDGHVTGLECLKMELGGPDESGRRAPKPIEGSEFIVPADTVILAIGEAPDLSCLPKGIEISEEGTIQVEPLTPQTSQPSVFAGGDCVSGPASFIEAIVAGKQAAECIDQYLKGEREVRKEEILEGRKQT